MLVGISEIWEQFPQNGATTKSEYYNLHKFPFLESRTRQTDKKWLNNNRQHRPIVEVKLKARSEMSEPELTIGGNATKWFHVR